MKFRAAVLDKVGAPLTIDTLEMAPLAPGDVLVKVRASGLCHTDLEVIQGSLAYPLPIVLGHEGAGVVEAVGPAVSSVKPGDHVICSWNPHCGHCFYCERAVPILCEPFTRHQPRGLLLDGTTRMSRDGEKVHHYSVTSTHAEYTVVPESGAIVIPKEMPFDRACIIGCGVMTGVGAVVRKAKVEPGASVLVIGCGAVGLNALQGARLAGAATIIAADVGAAKLERAKAFGATHAVDAERRRRRRPGPRAHRRPRRRPRVRGGRASCGVPPVRGGGAPGRPGGLARQGQRQPGRLVPLGIADGREADRPLELRRRPCRSATSRGCARSGSTASSSSTPSITRRIALDEINDGFAGLARGEGIRTVIELP